MTRLFNIAVRSLVQVPREKLWEVRREYSVMGSLLRAIQSLYSQSESFVCVLGTKSVSFPVGVGLRQGCALSPILFVIFMAWDLQHSLDQLAAECEAAGMRISTPKSVAM